MVTESFPDGPGVHGGDDGRGGPRVERLVDQTDPDAEARDHDQNPDDSRIDVPSLGNVRQAVDRGRLKELVNFTFDALSLGTLLLSRIWPTENCGHVCMSHVINDCFSQCKQLTRTY